MGKITGNKMVDGGEKCDISAQEGELLLGSSPVAADDNMIVGDLREEKMSKKKRQKRSKIKQAASVAAIPENVLGTEGENLVPRKTAGHQPYEGTEMRDRDGAQEGGLLLRSYPVGADDNIISADKIIDQDTNETVVTVGNPCEEKKDPKMPKKRNKKKSLSVAVNPEQNLETEGEKFASQNQNCGIQQAAEYSDSAQGALLLKSSPALGDADIKSEDKSIVPDTNEMTVPLGNLHEEEKDQNLPKKRKKKNALSVAVHLEQNMGTGGENLASQTKSIGIEQITGNQSFEGTEMRDGAQEGSLLPKGSPVGADDNIISEDKIIDKDATEDVVTSGNLHEEKKDQKLPKKRKRRSALSIAANPDQNSQTDGEKLTSQTPNSGIEQATDNQAVEGTEIRDSAQECALLFKSSPALAENYSVSEDRSIDQDSENVVTHEEKKVKRTPKSRKMKQAATPMPTSETECENVACLNQKSEIEQTTGIQYCEGTEMRDGAQEGSLLPKGSPVGADDNIISEDKIIDKDATENVVTSGNLHEEKTDQKLPKKRKRRSALSIAANTDQNSQTEGEKLTSQTPNSGIEQATDNQAVEGTEIRDCAQECTLLFKSSPAIAEDNIVSEDRSIDQDSENMVTLGTSHEENKVKRTPKRRKMKHAAIPTKNSETECENFACPTQNSGIEQTTGNKALEGTDVHDTAQEGASLIKGISAQDTPNDGPSNGKKRKKKRNPNVNSDLSISCEALEGTYMLVSETAVTENHERNKLDLLNVVSSGNDNLQTTAVGTTRAVSKSDGMPVTTVSEDILKLGKLKENEAYANNVGSLSDVAADQEMQTLENCSLKKRRKKKDKKPANSQFEELKEGERLPNQIAEENSTKNTDTALSMEGIMLLADESTHIIIDNCYGDKPESMTDKENKDDQKRTGMALVTDIVKPPQDTDKDLSVKGELVTKDFQAQSIEKNDIQKNDISADHTVTAADVAENDPENPDTCEEREKKKKRQLSGGSQLELNNKDGAKDSITESNLVCDMEPKQTTDGNNVAPGEGIPIGASSGSVEDACCSVSNGETSPERILLRSPSRSCGRSRSSSRKLLILDINGLLADIVVPVPSGYKPDMMLSRKAVFKRPFCESFLQFCFEKFDVGVWSSRVKLNVDKVLGFLMGEMKKKLVFYWDRSHCTNTGFCTIENRDKHLVLKELRKLWDDHPLHLGKYDQFNTLLLDDSPYKALCNPADTAIFPFSYQYTDVNDCSLGPGGDLHVYLERLAMADNIPEYVRNNPFGQRPIGKTNLSWKYYKQVLDSRHHRRTDNGL